MGTHDVSAALGLDRQRPADAVFLNSPLKDYGVAARRHSVTLPVLGLAYIATSARAAGFNVGVLDVEALGLSPPEAAVIVNEIQPRWVGLNLLAPTYETSKAILQHLDAAIEVMVGGHHAKAMPTRVLADTDIPRLDALVIGEGDLRVPELLGHHEARHGLPGVFTRDARPADSRRWPVDPQWLTPDLDSLPFVDRTFLAEDPIIADGLLEANLVGSRGCPYDCAFCGSAISVNRDQRWRLRSPDSILGELSHLREHYGLQTARFVDDLFLAHPRFMEECLGKFVAADVPSWLRWDATGRINVLAKAQPKLLNLLADAGAREVALGVESGSDSVLRLMDKRITVESTTTAVRGLLERGIAVKGYFIFGFPGETRRDLQQTIRHIHDLWGIADATGTSFRASAFEFRPYPGTPVWSQLVASGRWSESELMAYEHIDLTDGELGAVAERDEFNFSSNIQFGDVSLQELRSALTRINAEQAARSSRQPGPASTQESTSLRGRRR